MSTKHHRAKPLPPAERKQAIVDAIIPLLLDKGAAVTSREMADAAGIAEGTIFRVFPDKPSIIKEAVKTSMDPAPVCDALALVPQDAPLCDQLEAAAGILLERNERVAALMGVLHSIHHSTTRRRTGPPRFVRDSNAATLAALTELLQRHSDQLRVAPERAAIALRGLIFANAHPMAAPDEKTTPAEIVDLLLGGIVTKRGTCLMLVQILRRYLAPFKREITIVIGLQLIGTIAALTLPSLNADIIDKGVILGDTGYILRLGAWMLAVSLVQVGATITAVYFGARAAMAFGRDVRSALFRRVISFSSREMARFGAPSLLTRNTNDVQQVQMLVLTTFTMLITAPIMMVGGVFMALREDVGLSWLIVALVPILAIIIWYILSHMVPGFRVMQKKLDSVNRVLREQITGIRVVRAFVREPFEADRFGEANTDLTNVSITVGRWMAAIFPAVMLIMNVSSVAVLWFGSGRVDSGAMQIGSLTAFLTYIIQILMSVMMATFMFMLLPRASVSADRIGEVLDTDSSVVPPAEGVTELPKHSTVEFEDAGFSYPGADHAVLESVTFTAQPGQTTAVIGSTGTGKTTLVNLIPRLFDATSGRVLVDGVDVRQIDPDTLWNKVGFVPQTVYLFSGTVASNLRYGKPDATEAEMWEALDIAQARDFVEAMPDGLDSAIAQGGTNVSGGQRQRLAIARALIRRPELYLFDDSFSALDVATDARLRHALKGVTADATVIIVAQRVATIMDADQIVVLENGGIVGLGTHDELMETCSPYAEIVDSQLAAERS